MATSVPITGLPVLTPASVQGDDLLPIVDVHDLTDPIGTTKQVTLDGLGYYTIPRGTRTVSTLQAYLADNAVVNVADWGTVANGSTDDSGKIQAAINSLATGAVGGGLVWFAGTANTQYAAGMSLAIPKRLSGGNFTNWYALQGQGRGAPQIVAITGLANLPVIDASGSSSSVYSYYREIRGLFISGASIAQVGIDIRFNEHFKLEDLFINGMANGSGQAAGVRIYGAICSQFRDVKVHDGNGHGLYTSDGSGNFFNANLVEGCSFLNLTGDGMYFSGGVSGCSFLGNTFEKCNYGARFSGYSVGTTVMSGNYFEQNAVADLFLGENTTMNGFSFLGNYLNGYAGASGTTYTPIQLKFANACTIQGNQVAQATKSATGYYLLDANMSGGSVTNCTVVGNSINSLSSTTAPNLIYNLPGAWVDNGNSLIDPIFAPLLPSNLSHGRLPYGGWTLSATGSGTVIRGADVLSTPSLQLTRPAGGDSAAISQIFPIGPEYKNRFVTMAVPVVDLVGSKACNITVTPNGTNPQVTTVSVSTLAANGERIAYVMGFAPSDATQITVTITAASAASNFLIGQSCLYVGATKWYSNACDAFGYGAAAPTTGTWARGDVVLNGAPSAAGTPGWVCTTAGTPGTWKAMANVAA